MTEQMFKDRLGGADMANRQMLAKELIDDDVDLFSLGKACLEERTLRLKYLWFLTEVGLIDASKLNKLITPVFRLCQEMKIEKTEATFANYWLICPLVGDDVTFYLDELLKWATDPKYNATTKLRSNKVLENIGHRFPELQREIQLELSIASRLK